MKLCSGTSPPAYLSHSQDRLPFRWRHRPGLDRGIPEFSLLQWDGAECPVEWEPMYDRLAGLRRRRRYRLAFLRREWTGAGEFGYGCGSVQGVTERDGPGQTFLVGGWELEPGLLCAGSGCADIVGSALLPGGPGFGICSNVLVRRRRREPGNTANVQRGTYSGGRSLWANLQVGSRSHSDHALLRQRDDLDL